MNSAMTPGRTASMRAVLAAAALLAVAVPLTAAGAVRENPKCTPNPVFEKFPKKDVFIAPKGGK